MSPSNSEEAILQISVTLSKCEQGTGHVSELVLSPSLVPKKIHKCLFESLIQFPIVTESFLLELLQ